VTETIDTPAAPAASRRSGGGLSSKLLPELKQIAGGLGIRGVSSMKKAQLVEAIRAAQAGQSSIQSSEQPASQPVESAGEPSARQEQPASRGQRRTRVQRRDEDALRRTDAVPPVQGDDSRRDGGEAREAGRHDEAQRNERQQNEAPQESRQQDGEGRRGREPRADRAERGGSRQRGRDDAAASDQDRDGDQGRATQREKDRDDERETPDQSGRNQARQDNRQERQDGRPDNRQERQENRQDEQDDDEAGGSNRRRRRRGRDRERERPAPVQSGFRERRHAQDDIEITEDDVLVPVAGIVDILENYAFVRTSGYLPGPNDVYVSLSMVRKYGLRKGDAVTGQVRQPREGERKEKFNPLVRLETVNGGDVDAARNRVEFSKLTPLYASERLRLETDQANMIGRVIDIAAPIGKGQRGLIVSPPKAGKTMVLQSIANAITTNNPECHLMIVLVDERPEEVTDFQRTVKGEVIASTFDRPASDHTTVAELAIERAKRLVELGHDVVVLLDGITRQGRAYNLAAPASGRILSGGVDSSALYPPKKFFGAARNIEDGGSLTILATALVETGSKMDEVIFEEFKGTGNMELRLRREFADRRLFPAIDAVQSGTRREELLLSKEELAIIWKLRRVLSGLDGQQALELLLERLRKSRSNVEFLMQIQKTTPTADGE
jgi:transcription termination factor Rho